MVPVLIGLAFYLCLRNRLKVKEYKILLIVLFCLQVAFTIGMGYCNYNYWGYTFKRPAIFGEITNAKRVLTCSKVSNVGLKRIGALHTIADTSDRLDNLYGRKDPYYNEQDRLFLTFEDIASHSGYLYHISEIYKDPKKKIAEDTLRDLYVQAVGSNIIDKGEKGWNTSGSMSGRITEFLTESNVKYAFAGLSGGEVSNDHYPTYEFLFIETGGRYELIKKQRFYTDVAGIELMEYATIAPFFSLILSIVGGLVFTGMVIANKIYKLRITTQAA
jgi:hypothetical protein